MRVVTLGRLGGTNVVPTPNWPTGDPRELQGWLHPMALWRTATAPQPPWLTAQVVPNDSTTIQQQAKFAVIGLPIMLLLGGAAGYFIGKRFG